MSESAFDYLSSHSLLFLATASSAGDVHIAPMFYATEGKSIFFSAPDGSATSNNLRDNPVAAIAIAEPTDDWSKAKGLQIEGPVAELDGEPETAAGHLFQAKFPHLGDDAMHTHYWRLDAMDVRYIHDEAADQAFESLGQTWSRDNVS
jgi:uncharacterized protein YhbP (UPF0306 family)